MKKVFGRKTLFLGLGVALFCWVIARLGLETVSHSFTQVGSGYVLIVAWPAVYYICYTWGWYLTFPVADRLTIPWGRVFRARMAGEAVNYLTPLGTIGGEPARALLMRGDIPLATTAATVILDRTLYLFATILFTLLGMGVAYVFLDLSKGLRWTTLLCFLVLSGIMVLLFFAQRNPVLSRAARWSMRWGIGRNFWLRKLPRIEILENTIRDFYRKRPRDFGWAFLLHILGRAGGTFEIWLMLRFLGAFAGDSVWHQAMPWWGPWSLGSELIFSLLIAVFIIVINFAFFMFPSQIGVAEGSTAFLFKMLGFDPALGAALQIVRRVKSLFYIALGLILAAQKSHRESPKA